MKTGGLAVLMSNNIDAEQQYLQNHRYLKAIAIILLLLACAGLTYYFHWGLRLGVLFPHFFYIPIVLAGLWWGKRGLWVPVLLGTILIVSHFLSSYEAPITKNILRTGVFVIVGLTIGFLRDQAIRSQKNLREARDYLRALLHHANAPIIVWDSEGKTTLFNAAFERITGYRAEEIMGKPLTTLFNGKSKNESLQKIEQTLRGQSWEAVEIPITCKDGEERILLWDSANIYEPDGKTLIATIAQGQDITLRKQAEKALHLQIDELEAHGHAIEALLERRIKELAAHERIVNSMLRTLDLDKRLEIGLNEVLNLTGAEKGAMSLIDGNRLVTRKQFGFSETYLAWAGDLAFGDVPSCEEVSVGWNDTPDSFSKSRLETALKKEGIKSWVTVPFKSEHGFLGIIVIASPRPQAFSEEQINLLSRLVNTLTLMLEQASLFRTAQERLARLTTLREIDQAISANLSLGGIIEVLLQRVNPHISVDAVGISLIDWERKRSLLARFHLPGDVDIEGEAFALSDNLLTQMGHEKKPIIIYDVKTDPRLQNHRNIVRKYRLCSYVGVPLIVQDKAIGILHLFTVEPRKFSQEDLDFFATMAGQAAISVQNARLYEEAKRRAENMKNLAEISFNFSQFSYEEDLAKQMLTNACQLIRAEIGTLFWLNEKTNTLEYVTSIGITEKKKNLLRKQSVSLADPKTSISGMAAFTRKPFYVPDISKEPLWKMKFPTSGSAYIVPLAQREHLFGMYIFLSPAVDDFLEEQRSLANTLAGYISSALENIRLFRETQHAYNELRKTQKQLLQAQKMEAVGTLAGGVAHDFNNLLTGIQGYADLVLSELEEDNPLYLDMKEIQRNVGRAANLTRQLLLFSRRQPMEMVPLNLNNTIEDMMKMLNRLIGEDISISTELAGDLWTVNADPGTIEQVIMNLIVNARDAMPNGGDILIKTENVPIDKEYCEIYNYARPGNFVCISVADTGIGMDKQTIERIFEPFFTTKGLGRGTGLGLSVVYGIVKQHEGWINVDSEPDHGTTFDIYLPAISAKPKAFEEELSSLEKFQGENERILVVEDEESLCELNMRRLRENGYVPFSARGVEEAQQIFDRENGNFALIFCDVVLPDGSGLQLVEKLTALNPELQVILTSGYSDQKAKLEEIRKSGFHFLQKPYSLHSLLKTMKETLKKPAIDK